MDLQIGQFMLTAFQFAPAGTFACNGQSLSIASYPMLYEVLGTAWGGNGTTSFNVPNLPPVQAASGALNWVVVAQGAPYASGTEALYGEARLLPVAPPPQSPLGLTFLPAQGQSLEPAQYPALYSLMGTQFGGDGTTSFALPRLSAVKPTNGPPIPYWICTTGLFPQLEGDSVTPLASDYMFDTYLGSLVQLAWLPADARTVQSLALCLGQTMPIGNWQALFALLGTTYGSSASTNFLLPNLPEGASTEGLTYAVIDNGLFPPRP